ncbi:shikimate kinase [Corynebacterium lowii]|uniref:Shikimate kinase n=1 Tax=Corynebacterium lowii TaxID=1544413 RepID=A0A0Q0U205_9CORY|nr:shikimate kinase [Corynebacterium lowii]KQB85845.1 Shikimate kinase [Corynebacterium lowii]MDP9851147.1 shikimate kinase [Corynebacterium lowii]
MTPTVVLVGPPGAGKSTVARRLGNALNLPVRDTDESIAQEYGKPCGEVLKELGEPAFRDVEASHVAEALKHAGVLCLGGGAITHPETRVALQEHVVVWVDVSAPEGIRRASAEGGRPLLETDDPAQRYQELLTQREPWYKEVSTHRVRTDGRTPAQVVAVILGILDVES